MSFVTFRVILVMFVFPVIILCCLMA